MTKESGRNPILSRRSMILLGAQGLVVAALGYRMRQLGVEQSEDFRLLAEENRVNIRLLPPSRGLIFDRRGTPLALNRLSYKIQIVREQSSDPEAVLRRLAEIIPISEDDIERVLIEITQNRAFVPVTVADDLEWEHIAAVSANAPALPGITAERGFKRSYPKGNDFAHIVGYVGPVSDYDLSKLDDPDPLLMIPEFLIGKNGIEARTDENLRGSAGVRRIEVNSVGRVIRELERDEGNPGNDLQLTVDHRIQAKCLEVISAQPSASAVVMDVENGDILACASVPTFDPNKFVGGISVGDWNALNTNKYKPMLNKTVSGIYPPGSTFKMLVALAALEHDEAGASEKVFCGGHITQSGKRFHCWKRGGHGSVNMVEAIRYSCDVYFYEVAKRVGINRITEMANRFGLGVRPDVPLPAVYQGLTPTRDWKVQRHGVDWFPGDTFNAGIGQGFVLATPLQLAVMTARLATGKAVKPRFVHSEGGVKRPDPEPEDIGVQVQHLDMIRRAMFDVSNHPRGTAYWQRPTGGDFKIAGKTGTSQVRRITMEERAQGVFRNEDLPWERRDHGLFVAYAPHDNPRYAVSVITEHGGGSGSATPLAREIFDFIMGLEDRSYLPPLSRKALSSSEDV
ncbi:MAG: penicillin-binding protein 2 [Pseudomonadota bacterium]